MESLFKAAYEITFSEDLNLGDMNFEEIIKGLPSIAEKTSFCVQYNKAMKILMVFDYFSRIFELDYDIKQNIDSLNEIKAVSEKILGDLETIQFQTLYVDLDQLYKTSKHICKKEMKEMSLKSTNCFLDHHICIFCGVDIASYYCTPCMHTLQCEKCNKILVDKPMGCPYCNERITSVKKIIL